LQNVKRVLIADKENWELKNVALKDVLRKILSKLPVAPTEATYIIRDNLIVITTDDWAPYVWMRQDVSLDCEKEELASALKKLARTSGANLVLDHRASKEAETRITLRLQGVTLEVAVTLLGETVGLKPVRVGNALLLTTKENAQELLTDRNRPPTIGPCPLPSPVKPGEGGAASE
jgi:hypothetical protein